MTTETSDLGEVLAERIGIPAESARAVSDAIDARTGEQIVVAVSEAGSQLGRRLDAEAKERERQHAEHERRHELELAAHERRWSDLLERIASDREIDRQMYERDRELDRQMYERDRERDREALRQQLEVMQRASDQRWEDWFARYESDRNRDAESHRIERERDAESHRIEREQDEATRKAELGKLRSEMETAVNGAVIKLAVLGAAMATVAGLIVALVT